MANTSEKLALLAEIEGVIKELEEYRERLVYDALQTAQKLKFSKQLAMADLEQNKDIIMIDKALKVLLSRRKYLRSRYTKSR